MFRPAMVLALGCWVGFGCGDSPTWWCTGKYSGRCFRTEAKCDRAFGECRPRTVAHCPTPAPPGIDGPWCFSDEAMCLKLAKSEGVCHTVK
jgi:hypothetical protein